MMPQSWIGKTIGDRYQIEALLGQGGMSAVYRATDPNLRRPVAIKMIHTHLSTDPNFVGRFKEEAAAVARLRHPNIVQVHDFNIDGETYYMVMEYLIGETLQARLKRLNATGRTMPLEEVIRLSIQLCEAIGYAHNHELVHRDIKPANIMLDVNGQAILMDFGIVKIIGGDYHTATGATIGTAMYMSPEQIRAERVDERADIYSLGVTLYEMVSGRPPYMADSALTLMMMVLNDPLPELNTIRTGIPASLQAVVYKALEKEPDRRYQSMAEMNQALQLAQAELAEEPPIPVATQVEEESDQPVTPPVTLPTVTDQPAPGSDARTLPDAQPEAVTPPADRQTPVRSMASLPTQQDVPQEAVQSRPASTIPGTRVFARPGIRRLLLAAGGLITLAVLVTLVVLYLNYRKPPGLHLVPINSPPEAVNVQTAPMVVNLGTWETGAYIVKLTFSPDSSLLGTASNRDWVRYSQYRFFSGIWQVHAGELQKYLLGQAHWVYAAAFSPDGKYFGSVSDDGFLMIWQVADGKLVQRINGQNGSLTGLSFSPNSQVVATSSMDGVVSLWEVNSGTRLRELRANDNGFVNVVFSPDGALLAAASYNNTILLWQANTGSLVQTLRGHNGQIYQVAFSPDGTRLASASEDKTLRIWRVSDGSLLLTLSGHTEAVYAVAFSPDGSLLASGGSDGTLRLWRVSDGAWLSTPVEYSDSINSVVFSPDGHLLVSAAADGVIQFWGISQALQNNQ